jgi:hypothetical protein
MNGIRISDEVDNWDNDDNSWTTDRWYKMTDKGLESLEKDDKDWNKDPNDNGNDDSEEKNYRYHKGDSLNIKIDKGDTSVNIKLKAGSLEISNKEGQNAEEAENNATEAEPATSKSAASKMHGMISVLDLLKIDS